MAQRLDAPAARAGTVAPSRAQLPGGGNGGVGAAAFGEALTKFGQTFQDISDKRKFKKDQELKQEDARLRGVEVAQITTDFRGRWSGEIKTRAANYDGSGDFHEPFSSDIQKDLDTVLEGIEDENTRAIVEQRLIQTAGAYKIDAQNQEIVSKRARAYSGLAETTALARNQILSDPAQFEAALDDIPALSAAVPGALRDKWVTETRAGYASAYVDGLNDENPDRLKVELESGVLDELLNSATKARAIAANERTLEARANDRKRAIRQKKLEAKQAKREQDAEDRIQNQIDQVELQTDLKSHFASISASGVPMESVTYERVLKTMGPKQAAKFLIQEEQAQAVHGALEGLPTATPAEISAREKTLVPVPGSSNFSSQQQIYAQYLKQKSTILKARAEDPAAYAAQTGGLEDLAQAAFNPDALEPLDGESEDDAQVRVRQARSVYLEASQKAQADMGIAPLDRRVLTKGQSEDWITSLTEGQASDKRQAAASLSQVYGNFTGAALEELKQAGLPDGYDALIDLSERNGRGAAALADALSNRADLKKTLDSSVRKDIREHAENDLAALLDTMRFSPRAAGDIDSYTKAYEVLAQQLVSTGESTEDARAKAAQEIMRGFFYTDTYRIPADVAHTKFSGNSNGLDYNISGDKIIEAGAVGFSRFLDTGLSDQFGTPGMDSDTSRKSYAAKVRANGKWVNGIDSSGEDVLQLVLNNGGRYISVIGKSGDPIEYSFDDMAQMGGWEMTGRVYNDGFRRNRDVPPLEFGQLSNPE